MAKPKICYWCEEPIRNTSDMVEIDHDTFVHRRCYRIFKIANHNSVSNIGQTLLELRDLKRLWIEQFEQYGIDEDKDGDWFTLTDLIYETVDKDLPDWQKKIQEMIDLIEWFKSRPSEWNIPLPIRAKRKSPSDRTPIKP